MTGNLGPKLNLFSLTVCTLEQYLTNGSEKTVLLPQSPVLKWDQHCCSLCAMKTATGCANQHEFRDSHDQYIYKQPEETEQRNPILITDAFMGVPNVM